MLENVKVFNNFLLSFITTINVSLLCGCMQKGVCISMYMHIVDKVCVWH